MKHPGTYDGKPPRKTVALYMRVRFSSDADETLKTVADALDANGWGKIKSIYGSSEYAIGAQNLIPKSKRRHCK